MKILKSFLILTLFSFIYSQASALPAFDNEFQCTSEAKANQYIRDFNVDVNSFGGKELCNADTDFKKLMNDLQIIEEGQFANNGNNNLIKNFLDQNRYYQWMKDETRGMDRGNDVPFATAYNSWGYFTMQDGWAKLSTLGRVGTVVHEARHTAGYRHIACTQGPYAGANLPGCDSTYEYGGSHGIEMEYYARVVVLGQNFHPLYKKMARLMALGRSNFTFNRPILSAREGLLLIKKDQSSAVLVDGNSISLREITGQGKLKRTSFGASLFDGIGAWAFDLYENYQMPEKVKDDYSYFKLLMGAKGAPQAYTDFEEIDLNNKRFVVAIDQNGSVGTYNFPSGGWNNFQNLGIKPNQIQTRISGKTKGVYLIENSGLVHEMDPLNSRIQRSISQWNPSIKAIVMSPQQEELTLNTSGEIFKSSSSNGYLEGEYESAVNVPLYDAFSVK